MMKVARGLTPTRAAEQGILARTVAGIRGVIDPADVRAWTAA